MTPKKNAAAKRATRTQSELEFAFRFLEDEHETLLALAIVLQNHLEPVDPAKLEDCDIVAWRMSQVLHERITNTQFLKNMRELMLGDPAARRGGR